MDVNNIEIMIALIDNYHNDPYFFFIISGVAKGQERGRLPPLIKCWCLSNAQICNKVDTLEDSFAIASATDVSYLEMGVSLQQRGCFPII